MRELSWLCTELQQEQVCSSRQAGAAAQGEHCSSARAEALVWVAETAMQLGLVAAPAQQWGPCHAALRACAELCNLARRVTGDRLLLQGVELPAQVLSVNALLKLFVQHGHEALLPAATTCFLDPAHRSQPCVLLEVAQAALRRCRQLLAASEQLPAEVTVTPVQLASLEFRAATYSNNEVQQKQALQAGCC